MADPWFSAELRYEGIAHAEFEDPLGSVECDAEVRVNETGDCSLSMVVRRDQITCVENLRFGVREFVTGNRPLDFAGQTSILVYPVRGNPCKILTVQTNDGTLSVTRILRIRHFVIPDVEATDAMRIEIEIAEMRFVSREEIVVRYFAIPLLNFISDYRPIGDALSAHPLLFRSNTPLTAGSVEAESDRPDSDSRSQGILFQLNGLPAFIQPLPNYSAQTQALTEGKIPVAVTAVLVGELEIPSARPRDLKNWTAMRLVPALSFATGSFVGATWAEFRDDTGWLAARHHLCLGRRSFDAGHRVILEHFDWGTGDILTLTGNALNSKTLDPTMAMQYAVKCGCCNRTSVEDKLRAVSNALECLFAECHVEGDVPFASLDSQTREAAESIIEAAEREMNNLADSLTGSTQNSGNDSEKLLRRMGEKISQIPRETRKDFGLLVVKLLDRYGFSDAAIADKYFDDHGILKAIGVTSWQQMLAKYRAKAAHGGYFDFAGGKYDLLQVRGVADHLHDIVIRTILRAVGYTRTYQTPLTAGPSCVSVEWVTPLTLANTLPRYSQINH